MRRILFAGLFGVALLIFGGLRVIQCVSSKQEGSCYQGSTPTIDIDRVAKIKNLMPVVIIGSGPAGMTAAQYAVRSGLETLVLTGQKPGGALTETSYIENWPGKKKILGKELMQELDEQAKSFGARVLDDTVIKVDFTSWPYCILTERGYTIKALTVIIATGSTPRSLDVPGEQQYWGKGVTTCAICDAPFHKGHDVVVIGGGDSAVEEALQLASYAKNITVLVRKEQMRASAIMQERIKQYPHIKVRYNVEVQEIVGDQEHVTGVKLFNNAVNNEEFMDAQGVFLAIGHEPNTQLFKDYLKMDAHGYLIMAGRTQQTSLPGVFAAGDVQDNTYRQAGVAAGDSIKAALDAVSFLQHHGYTTGVAQELSKNFFEADAQKKDRASLITLKTTNELQHALEQAQGPVIIDFYADYCSSCMRMLPSVEVVAHELSDKVTFYKVDVDESKELPEYCQVQYVPTLLVYDKGKLVARYNKPMSENQLREFAMRFVNDSQSAI